MVFYGLADVVYKRAATAGVKPHHFLMAQAWFFAPAVLIYALASGQLHVVPAAAWGAVAGLCVFAGLYNFSRSLREGAVSVNAPIFRLNFTITAALAVIVLGDLGELLARLDRPVAVGGRRAAVKIPFDVFQQRPDIEVVHPHALLIGQHGRVILVGKLAVVGQLKGLYEQKPVFLFFRCQGCSPQLVGVAAGALRLATMAPES